MHVVGCKPLYMDQDTVNKDHLEAEKKILREQALASGKPSNIIDKIVEGRLIKFYEEHCLMLQRYVMDETMTIKALIKEFNEKNEKIKIDTFLRMACGDVIT